MGCAKQVAVKRLHESLTENESILKALINEARLGGQLKHPNIVEVYEFNKVGTSYYLALEFVDGWTLDRVIKLGRDFAEPIPHNVVLDIVCQACEGLHYAHTLESLDGQAVRLVHRDLKPANIILGRDGIAKIMDFGIAKADTNLFKTTLADTTKGTPHYMSPEQVAGDPNLTATSDIFALGAVLYELLTGKLLFRGDSLVSVLFSVAKAQVDEHVQEVDALVPGLGRVMQRCLEKDSSRRHASAEELRLALEDLRSTVEGAATIQSYLYTLRNHMVARSSHLQDGEETVADEAPQFATLMGSDLNITLDKPEDIESTRKAADEAIAEITTLRDQAPDDRDAQWLETAFPVGTADTLHPGQVLPGPTNAVVPPVHRSRPGTTRPTGPDHSRNFSVPGTADPTEETQYDLSRQQDIDATRDFPGQRPRRKQAPLLRLVLLLLILGAVGAGALLLGLPPLREASTSSSEFAEGPSTDSELPDLAVARQEARNEVTSPSAAPRDPAPLAAAPPTEPPKSQPPEVTTPAAAPIPLPPQGSTEEAPGIRGPSIAPPQLPDLTNLPGHRARGLRGRTQERDQGAIRRIPRTICRIPGRGRGSHLTARRREWIPRRRLRVCRRHR